MAKYIRSICCNIFIIICIGFANSNIFCFRLDDYAICRINISV